MSLFLETLGFGLVLASVTAIGALGITLQFGLTNLLNLSYGSVMTVTAFAAYLMQTAGLNIWVCFVLGGVVGSVVTMLIGKLIFKPFVKRQLRLFEMVIVTIGLGTVIQYVVYCISRDGIFEFRFSQGSLHKIGPLLLTTTELTIIALGIVTFVLLEGLLRGTRLGKALRAMAANRHLASACGIPAARIVDVTWILSGFLCGLAGVIYVISSMNVSYATGTLFLPLVLSAAVLGGFGSPTGAVAASLVMGIVTEIVSLYGGAAFSTVAAFGVLIVVLLAKPSSVVTSAMHRSDITV